MLPISLPRDVEKATNWTKPGATNWTKSGATLTQEIRWILVARGGPLAAMSTCLDTCTHVLKADRMRQDSTCLDAGTHCGHTLAHFLKSMLVEIQGVKKSN